MYGGLVSGTMAICVTSLCTIYKCSINKVVVGKGMVGREQNPTLKVTCIAPANEPRTLHHQESRI